MSVDVKVPEAGESISEVYIARWHKQAGDAIAADEVLVEIETDKASMEISAPSAGIVDELLKDVGDAAKIGEVIARIGEGDGKARKGGAATAVPAKAAKSAPAPSVKGAAAKTRDGARDPGVVPSARRILEEAGLDASEVEGSGKGGRVTKEDALKAVAAREDDGGEPAAATAAPADAEPAPRPRKSAEDAAGGREIEIVPMSPIRRRIAERLVHAQSTAALLTTFNEIDMSAVMELRRRHKEAFQERHGAKLGFMSFFVKAAIEALKAIPQLNAQIRGTDMVFHNYFDVGIAVGGGKGLVVPVVRSAETLSFGEIESTIADLAQRARDNQLRIDELQGGTFTISNGGVYGSLLSTPILNPPQSGVLGLHAIQERPVGIDGQIVLRPMMNVALTYDHRIVDGREAVTFLVKVKQAIEDPARMLLEI